MAPGGKRPEDKVEMSDTPMEPRFYRDGELPGYYIFPGLQVVEIEGKGLGVTTAVGLLPGQLIECCPVLLLAPEKKLGKDWARLHRVMLETVFSDYIFGWTPKYGAVALGYGGLYNHSSHPNAETHRITKSRRMVFTAKEAIPAGTEITIAYRTVWFRPVEEVPDDQQRGSRRPGA